MRLIATHNDKEVVIVGFLYTGVNHDTLKAIYIKNNGSIGVDDVADFTINEDKVEQIKNLKVKVW